MFYMIGQSNIVIENLVFDQGSTRGIQGDIYNGVLSFRSINSENISFIGNRFQNGAYLAGRNYGTQKNIRFYRNTFNNVDTAIHFYGGLTADGITIEENTVNGGTSECVAIISGQTPYTYAKNIKILITIYQQVKLSSHFLRGNTTACEIAYNTIENCLGGIVCNDTLIESQPVRSSQINIHDNTIKNGGWYGILAAGSNITISNNTITDYRADGIGFDPSITSENVIVKENIVDNCGTDGGYAGIGCNTSGMQR
jgi:parallel beta-helix repeat protein